MLHVIEKVEALWARIAKRLGRGILVLSFLSMLWGLSTAFTITRDYAHSARLVGYFAALVLVSIAFRTWMEYARRRQAKNRRELELAEEDAPETKLKLGDVLIEKAYVVEGMVVTVTQFCIQYIMMFCIPLLFLAQAWITLGLAVAVVASSLVDRWWFRLSRRSWYTGLVRSFSAVIATSFAFAVYFPQRLGLYYPVLSAVAILSILPWELLVQLKRPRAVHFLPCLGVILVVVIQAHLGSWIRVPLLSVWLNKPAIGTERQGRSLGDAWSRKTPKAKLERALAEGLDVCCLTPVVSPSGVMSPVTHEWLVDDQVIDRITLPSVRGVDDGANGFRTFSCKHNLPPPSSIHRITCRVLLEDRIHLGRADVTFDP